MDDPEPRQQIQLRRLLDHAEGSRNHGLGRDDRSRGGEDHRGNDSPARGGGEKPASCVGGIPQNRGRLAEVGNDQAREDDGEPGQGNGASPVGLVFGAVGSDRSIASGAVNAWGMSDTDSTEFRTAQMDLRRHFYVRHSK